MILSVKDLYIAYKGVRVVHGINFEAAKGKVTIIIGANGAGKTSIIKVIMGLLRAESGEIFYDERDITRFPPHKMSGIGISLCPEGRQLFPDMTVFENLEMGAYVRTDKVQIKEDINKILLQFPRLKERLTQRAGTLSGGEQEMLAIARAMMGRPKLLILDEPSWGLAPLMVEEVMRIMKRLNEESGLTILMVEQNANVALRYCDYAYVLNVGEIVMHGSSEVMQHDPEVQKIYLGA